MSNFLKMVSNAAQAANVQILDTSNAFNTHIDLQHGCPVGSLTLDFLLKGGLPDGRFHIVYGPSGAGKTTFVSRAGGMAQSMKRPVIHIDAEYAADVHYMKQLGLDMTNGENYVYVQPTSGDGAFRLIKRTLEQWIEEHGANNPDVQGPLIIVDSLKALAPEAQMEDDTKNPIGLQARMFSTWLPPIKALVGQSRAILLAVNQVRQNPMQMFGNPETMPGGEAITFFADSILRLSRVGKVEETDLGNTQTMRINFKKSKHVTPGANVDLQLLQGIGYDPRADISLFLNQSGVAEYERGWWTFNPYGYDITLPEGIEEGKRYRANEILPYMVPEYGKHYATAPLYAWSANLIWSGKVFTEIKKYNASTNESDHISDVSAGSHEFDFTALASSAFDIGKFKAKSGDKEVADENDLGEASARESWNIAESYDPADWQQFVGQIVTSTSYEPEAECTITAIDPDAGTATVVWTEDGNEEADIPVDTLYYKG